MVQQSMETEMYNAENTSDIRPLTDAELENVSGGHPAVVVAAAVFLAWAIGTDQPPLGATKEQMAGALGVGYLL
jgi:hypothetical protein